MTVPEVTLLYFDGCPNWRVVDTRLRVLAEELGFQVCYRKIDTPAEAEASAFRGSPTILIDGADPFVADGDEPVGWACRRFDTREGPSGSPTLEQLRSVLMQGLSAE